MTNGWIRLPRSIRDTGFWPKTRKYTRLEALLYLLIEMSFKPYQTSIGNKIINVPMHSVFTSQKALAKLWRWDRGTVKDFLSTLSTLNICSIETQRGLEHGYTLITFLNPCDFVTATDPGFLAELEENPALRQHCISIIEEGKETELVDKVSMYADQKQLVSEYWGDHQAFEGAAREGDYWELANGMAEAKQLMNMPRSVLEIVAKVKTAFGKEAIVIEFKRAAVGAEDDKLQGRREKLRRQEELISE